jgi:Gram-negative bacterial TonB protein C-terminal
MLSLEVNIARPRKSLSFVASMGLHAAVLTWVMVGPPLPGSEPPRRSLYDQEIKPNEKKIIWYAVKEKLPDISPTASKWDPRPPRAKELAKQTIVSGPKDDENAMQRIFMAAPEVTLPKPLPLPNVVAVAPPKVRKEFAPPPETTPKPKPAKALPEAPKVASVAAIKPVAIDAPKVKPTPLAFTPPPLERMQRQAAMLLPEAPATETVVEPNALPFQPGGATPQRRAFVAPAGGAKPRNDAPIAMPNAPDVAATPGAVANVNLPKTFTPMPNRPRPSGGAPGVSDADAPMVGSSGAAPNQASLAIVGLNPANTKDIPAPPGSHEAGFSVGPERRPSGGAGSASGAGLLGVPNLMVRGGGPPDSTTTRVSALGLAPTSRENLALAAKTVTPGPPPPSPDSTVKGAMRVAESPDPRLSGRVVYTVAIQMPNITSYTGSWLVWFAEHEPVPGSGPVEMKAPVPLHKVDPKYIAAAVAERVEGKVRLFGIIRKDGHVDSIALIQHVDVRLDQSAAGALGQWVFEPALRNGRPVDVDAVFEIPFLLAPRASK